MEFVIPLSAIVHNNYNNLPQSPNFVVLSGFPVGF